MGHSTRELVWKRDEYRCRYCGREVVPPDYRAAARVNGHPQMKSNTATVDHLIPKSHGGPRSLANLVTACRSCNQDKSDLTLREFLFGNQRNWRHLNVTNPSRHHLVARSSKRLHRRIHEFGDFRYAMKDLHLALIEEGNRVKTQNHATAS
jgi:hypothetical protein